MGQGQDYLAVKDFAGGQGCQTAGTAEGRATCPFTPSTVRIAAMPAPGGDAGGSSPAQGAGPSGGLVLRGMSLIDRRTGAHQSITVSPLGDFRRIYSGDVKIYERQ
jgi:hypothetical protein